VRKSLLSLLSACALASALSPTVVNAYINTEEDLLTGKSNSTLFIYSTNSVGNSIGQPEPATILVRCKAGKLQDIYISTPTYNADNTRVKIRWDDGEVKSRRWDKASGGTALFAPRAVEFFKKMTTHNRLVWAWSPYQKTESVVAFDLASKRDEINEMVNLCGVTFKADKPKRSSKPTKSSARLF